MVTTLVILPLSQTIFLPNLMHVYLMLAMVLLVPTFVHLVPEIDAENAGLIENRKNAPIKILMSIRRTRNID